MIQFGIEQNNKNMKYLILGDGKLATELYHQIGWDYISRKKIVLI